MKEILESGVDWLPRDVLALKTKKAADINKAGAIVALPSTSTTSTVIVPSKSNPKQPHIVNVYPSGKCECDKSCPGYSAEAVCAHVIAACLKMSRLPDFLRWFVATKRKTGGVNYSRAVSFGMPKGRGRKGEVFHLEKEKRGEATVSVERNDISSGDCNVGPQITPQFSRISGPPNMPTAFPHANQMHQSYRAVNIQPSSLFTPCPPHHLSCLAAHSFLIQRQTRSGYTLFISAPHSLGDALVVGIH